jgi:putative ABC transport system permease protein
MLALLIGILGIANTMVMSVFERTQEIGTLRALGWTRWQVLALIELESATLGLCGGIFGLLLGRSALRVMASLPQTAIFVTDAVGWPLLAQAMGIALLAGLIAGALPAWRAGQLSPVDALRHD